MNACPYPEIFHRRPQAEPELIQIRLFPDTGLPVTEMFRRLADHQINLTGVILDAVDGQLTGVCCISVRGPAASRTGPSTV